MAIHIALPPKPKVLLSLESGGLLQENTTYYFIVWWQGLTSGYYGGYSGEASDEVSITTTSTEKSIKMIVSWDDAAITAFADAGSGNVTVTSAGHGLIDGEKVYISDTTNYNGEYTVSNSQTDTFEITATFVTTETGHWYGVGPPTKPEIEARGYLFMWDTESLTSKIPWNSAGGSTYGHRKWYARVGVETGITATSKTWTEESGTQLSTYDDRGALCSQRYVEHPGIAWNYSKVPLTDNIVKKAKFCIKIDGGTHTWADVINAVKSDSRITGMYVISKRSFIGLCALHSFNDASVTIDGYDITLISSAWAGYGTKLIRSVVNIEGNIMWTNPTFGSIVDSKLIYSTGGTALLDQINAYATEIKNAIVGYYSYSGTITNYAHHVEGFIIYNTYYQFRYIAAGDTLKDMKFINSCISAIRPAVDYNFPDWENLEWDFSTVSSPYSAYDIRWEFSSSCPNTYTYINLLNPKTNRTGKKIINYCFSGYNYENYDFKVNMKFTVNLNIKDTDNNDIDSANIIIKDKNGNEVANGNTDSSGNYTTNIISYYQYFVTGQQTLSNVDNGPFTIEVSKIGFITYKTIIDLYEKYDKQINLKTFAELPAHRITSTKIKRKKV